MNRSTNVPGSTGRRGRSTRAACLAVAATALAACGGGLDEVLQSAEQQSAEHRSPEQQWVEQPQPDQRPTPNPLPTPNRVFTPDDFASAEGGSGPIDGPATTDVPETPIVEDRSGGPFAGRMIGTSTFSNTLLGLDMASGRYSTLAGNTDLDGIGATRRDATIRVQRDRGAASGAVLTVDDCREQRRETICLLTVDRDGNVLNDSSFPIDGRFPGVAKTSFDGQYVVINRTDRANGPSTLTIYTRDGEFVSAHAQSGVVADDAYDWLPDGRLVVSIDGNPLLGDDPPIGFYISKPFDADPDRRITLPSYYEDGRIRSIESSPDGEQLLINVEPRVGPKRPILVDLDTLGITQVIDRNDGDIEDVHDVQWGPDGEWVYGVISTVELLSGTGTEPGTDIVFLGRSFTLFAFRANGVTHPMPFDQEDLSADVVIIPTDDPVRPGGEVGAGEFRGRLAWIP